MCVESVSVTEEALQKQPYQPQGERRGDTRAQQSRRHIITPSEQQNMQPIKLYVCGAGDPEVLMLKSNSSFIFKSKEKFSSQGSMVFEETAG